MRGASPRAGGPRRRPLLRRVALSLLLGTLLGWGISEGAFLLLRDKSDHPPGRVEIVIPPGTAARVAAGEAPPGIPDGLTFVVGDVLIVTNQDRVVHEVGPIVVPPGSSGSLTLDQPDKYILSCSIRPSRYLGLDVRAQVTPLTRLLAILMTGPPMGILMALYSLVIWPITPARPADAPIAAAQPAETSA